MSNENQVHTIENFTKEVQNLDTFSLANKMLIMSKALIDCNGKDNMKTLLFMNQVICMELHNRVLAVEMFKEMDKKIKEENKDDDSN